MERRVKKVRSTRLRRYGITQHQYDTMWNQQGGVCAICKKALIRGDVKTHIDHDHSSGKVRGILCSTCNLGIGHLKHDVTTLLAAINYLINEKPELVIAVGEI